MNQNDKLDFLANSIKRARNVMEKVEDGKIQPSQNGGKGMTEEDIDRMLDNDDVQYLAEAPKAAANYKNMNTSRMPSAILESFKENPIADPTAPPGMENVMQKITQKAQPKYRENNVVPINENTVSRNVSQSSAAMPAQMDTKLLEYIIRKTVEETLEQVSKKTNVDENIQIKIGDKTFGGKISTLNEIKNKPTKK